MPARLTRLRAGAQPYAAGYSLLSWLGVTPAEHIDQVPAVRGAMAVTIAGVSRDWELDLGSQPATQS